MTQQDPLGPLRQQIGYAAHHAKQAVSIAQQAGGAVSQILAQQQAQAKQYEALQTAMNAITMSKGGTNPSIQYVENIPGRRVVFDYLVDIPITSDLTSVVQQTITISQEGPFVAVARYATFNSQFQFQVIDPDSGETANFGASGRTPPRRAGEARVAPPFGAVPGASKAIESGADSTAAPTR